jgi:hypothetical protein
MVTIFCCVSIYALGQKSAESITLDEVLNVLSLQSPAAQI